MKNGKLRNASEEARAERKKTLLAAAGSLSVEDAEILRAPVRKLRKNWR